MIRYDVKGAQEAQYLMLRQIAVIKPTGYVGYFVRQLGIRGIGEAIRRTPVDTGALRASHMLTFESELNYARSRIFIRPGVLNPRHGEATTTYAYKVHQGYRAWGHGRLIPPRRFYGDTVEKVLLPTTRKGMRTITSALRNAGRGK